MDQQSQPRPPYEPLRLLFERTTPADRPCYADCPCCRVAEIKSILRSVETDIRKRIERGDRFIGMGPLVD